MKIIKTYLDYQNQKTHALIFLPENNEVNGSVVLPVFAVFTHGHTADKGSILNWAIRLAEVGVSAILFDLPGHYLGNYSEVLDFDYFKLTAHELFHQAFVVLKTAFLEHFPLNEQMLESDQLKVVLGGHSLGALLSLKAMMLAGFFDYQKICICVGLGMAPKKMMHLFDTPFYKSTLEIREQLVSPALNPQNVFPWIREEKENLDVVGLTIHLINGIDDLVVGEDGAERFAESLVAKNNHVTIEKPSRLPHHEPQLAAGHVKKHLKKINWI